MDSDNVNSREKLDQLLGQGKISEADYLRLSKALVAAASRRGTATGVAPGRGRFRRNRQEGAICGLCAGYAIYSGKDVRIVRAALVTVFFLFLLALGPLKAATLVILYVCICGFVPYEREEDTLEQNHNVYYRPFMVAVGGLYFVLPFLYSLVFYPALEEAYQTKGVQVWSQAYQATLAGRAIDCVSEYRGWLLAGSDHWWVFPLVLVLAVWVTVFVGMLYGTLCRRRVQMVFGMVMVGLGAVWLFFLVGGTLYPLI